MLLLFDLDNTLIDRRTAFRRWAAAWSDELGLEPSAADWLIEADWDGYRPRFDLYGEAVERYGLDVGPEELLADYRRRFATYFDVDPAVNDALSRLRGRGGRIGVVTNGPSTQQAKIDAAQLRHLVDGVWVSEEVGVAKPERGIFEAAANALGLPLDQRGWMIGDHPEADIGGGTAVGLQTIWISGGALWPHSTYRPAVIAETIHEALAHLLAQPPS